MSYSKFRGLSKKLWKSSEPIFDQIKQTPLVYGLIEGLPPEQFNRFTQQDIYYLEQAFQPTMKVLREKAKHPSHKQLFSDFIVGTDIELVQLKKQLALFNSDDSFEPSEICTKYGKHLLKTVTSQSYKLGIIACLPCFLIFPALGQYIKNNVSDLDNHPQAAWIKVYAEELFDNAFVMAALVDGVTQEISIAEEEKALSTYSTSAQFELDFFKNALELEKSFVNMSMT